LNRTEIESFTKSFILFFLSLTLLSALLFYTNYTKAITTLDQQIFTQMRLCSFDLQCDQFTLSFETIEKQPLYTLVNEPTHLSSYFPVSQSETYLLKFSLNHTDYATQTQAIQKEFIHEFLLLLIALVLLSALFSLYALYPLRSALILTKEFVRDILHDVNTPLASLRLNVSMLARKHGGTKTIDRINQSIDAILALQNNLRSYLETHAMEKETFNLQEIIEPKCDALAKIYPHITITADVRHLTVHTNKIAFDRIIDNLLTNAAKYNRDQGTITITLNSNHLAIIDTGNGIKDSKKIFQRFYTEHAKGVGLGLHIVKKLCDDLQIKINVQSTLGEGTTFTLDLSALTHE
jgi:signal transduction histidine kinase